MALERGHHMPAHQAVSAREPCQVKDIQIKAWQATIENRCADTSCNYIKVVGEGSNQCAHATAVKVRIVAKDGNGQIVDSVERSLLNTRNTPPGPYKFELSDPFDYKASMASFELVVVETRQWK
jgi:hypothetical protein